MSAFWSTTPPATLRQWLLRSLGWTALCCLGVAVGWYCCYPFEGRIPAFYGWRLFGLALTQILTTIQLGRQAASGFEQLYRQTRSINNWRLTTAALGWWLLLGLLLAVWLVVDVGTVLGWLLYTLVWNKPGVWGF